MNETLNIILGAGFSVGAGLPMANHIDERFTRNNIDKLLKFSSEEWMWIDDKDDTTIHNGSLFSDHIGGSYILNEVVRSYIDAKGEFVSYEDFYEFVKDKQTQAIWYKTVYESAKKALLVDYPDVANDSSLLYMFNSPSYGIIGEILDHLISDMLETMVPWDEILIKYQSFIYYIKQYDSVNIFTLNHDLLLEALLREHRLDFSDGFTTTGSCIKYKDNFQEEFKDEFGNERIALHKLHGSIDVVMFQRLEKSDNGFSYYYTGDYTYFRPENYYAKHTSNYANPETGKSVQSFNPNLAPNFITGTNKTKVIQEDFMYRNLFRRFQDSLDSKNDMLIVGYSFRDAHVNKVIQDSILKHQPKITNVRPSLDFPLQGSENLSCIPDILQL